MSHCLECKDYINGKKDGAIEELAKIKAEIIAKHCNKCDVGYDIEKCYADNLDEWCEVFDNLKIIDKHIAKLKGETE